MTHRQDQPSTATSSPAQPGAPKATSTRRRCPRWRRWIAGGVASMVLGVGLSLAVLDRDGGALDRSPAQAIGAVVALSSQAISAAFGEGGLAGPADAWRGIRVYRPESGAWVTLDELGDERLPDRVVVLVHGLDEPGGIWDQLAPALVLAGHAVVRFEYANDQAIATSATELLAAFDRIHQRGVGEIDLVSHSMGGLVSFDAITRDGFGEQAIRVERFITIGTPFGGSPWARLRAVAEIREQVQRWLESDDLDPRRLLGFARDGVGQAGSDLLPGSDYLDGLSGRTLPAGVSVTNIVGRTVGNEQGRDLGALFVDGALGELIGRSQAGAVREEIDRLSSEFGDGVVPMSSAVLAGVSDVVVLKANHRGLVRNIELSVAIRQMNGLVAPPPPPAIEVVLDRLKRE